MAPKKDASRARVIALTIILVAIMSAQATAQLICWDKYRGHPQSITRIRIASASVMPDKWEKAANWQRIESMARRAVTEGGAQVVVTPEGALDGYVINDVNRERKDDSAEREAIEARFLSLGEPLDGPFIHKASALCRELRIYLVLGFLERQDDRLFNSAVLIDPEGDVIGRYAKTHFAQGYQINPDAYTAGDAYPVIDTPFGKVGMLICYDRQLPEPSRVLALKGAQVLFLPSYGGYTDRDGWNTVMLRTRAYENRMPLIFCHPFQSLLIDRHGGIVSMTDAGQIAYFEINTSPEKYEGRFRNRRPGLYGPLSREQGNE